MCAKRVASENVMRRGDTCIHVDKTFNHIGRRYWPQEDMIADVSSCDRRWATGETSAVESIGRHGKFRNRHSFLKKVKRSESGSNFGWRCSGSSYIHTLVKSMNPLLWVPAYHRISWQNISSLACHDWRERTLSNHTHAYFPHKQMIKIPPFSNSTI